MEQRDDFRLFAEARGLKEDAYPYSGAGLALFRCFCAVGLALACAGFLGLLLALGASSLRNGAAGSAVALVRAALSWCSGALGGACLPLAALLAVIAACYLALWVARSRCWERRILRDDAEAERVRLAIVEKMQARRRMREIRSKADKASSRSGGLGARLSSSDEATLEALEAIAQVSVRVNCRQSLEDSSILLVYQVTMRRPATKKAREVFTSELKNLEELLGQITSGDVSFSSPITSKDLSKVKYRGVMVAQDDPVREEAPQQRAPERPWSFSFPLELIDADREEAAQTQRKAQAWALERTPRLDDLLVTLDMGGERRSMVVGASSVRYDYRMPLKIDDPRVEKIPAKVDSIFGTSGATVDAGVNTMSVTAMLPPHLRKKVDPAQTYRNAFA